MRVVFACLLVGCSLVNAPDDHRPGGGLEPVPATAFCGGLAEAICDGYLDCCSTAAGERDACILQEQADCNDKLGGLLLDPRAGYDARVAPEVLAEGRTYATRCDVAISGWVTDRTGFFRVLRGTVDPGAECTPMNLFDLPAYFSCRELDQACVPEGLFGPSFCRDLRMIGGPCNTHNDCVDDLYCDAGRMCAPELANGSACRDGNDCASQACSAAVCSDPTPDTVYCSALDVL